MRTVITLVALLLSVNGVFAQKMSKYRLPSPESAIYDNNGNDLRSFIRLHKADLEAKGAIIKNASNNEWGYIQVRNATVPAIDKNGALNYTHTFDVTLAISATSIPYEATWWGREYNSAKGKLTWFSREKDINLGMEAVKYDALINEQNTKKMTLVEYVDTVRNLYDYEDLFKNCLFVKKGTIADLTEYAELVKYYNEFYNKFTSTNDPVLDGKSFITCFKAGSNQYVAYFNVVNQKISGKLLAVEGPFESDRIKFVNDIFRKLTGNYIYVYGNHYFGLDKIIRKKAESSDLKLEFVKTNAGKVFNKDI